MLHQTERVISCLMSAECGYDNLRKALSPNSFAVLAEVQPGRPYSDVDNGVKIGLHLLCKELLPYSR